MPQIELFHGSRVLVEKPQLAKCRPFNDYGPAFYCTENLELAKEWACNLGEDGIANCYRLELDGLALLDLNAPQYCILHWLAVLLRHRQISLASPTLKAGASWLLERYAIDIEPFDIVRGYRADDSYFSFARAFLRNEITLEQLTRAMRLGKLGEQYALRSQRAFDALEFCGWEHADAQEYWPLRAKRDERAREDYSAMIAGEPASRAAHSRIRLADLMEMGEEELHACLF